MMQSTLGMNSGLSSFGEIVGGPTFSYAASPITKTAMAGRSKKPHSSSLTRHHLSAVWIRRLVMF